MLRTGTRRAVQAGIIALTAFLLSEAALRVYQHVSPTFVFPDASYNRFRGRPFAEDYAFRLNSRGFKDIERARAKPAGVRRIVVIGDSFVFGVVPYEHGFPARLERDLARSRRAAGQSPVEVVNLGIPGTGPRQYLSMLIDEALPLGPDLVIVCVYVGNDFLEAKPAPAPRSYVVSLLRALWQLRHVEGRVIHGPAVYLDDDPTFSSEKYLELVAARSRIYTLRGGALEAALADALTFLTRIRDVCRARGVDLFVLGIPDEVQLDPELQREVIRALAVGADAMDFRAPNAVMARELAGRGIAYLDLLPTFRESANRRLYRLRDSHWNVAGNQRAAEAIRPVISARLP